MIIQRNGKVYTAQIETPATSAFLPSVNTGAVHVSHEGLEFRKCFDLDALRDNEIGCVLEAIQKGFPA
jgi:hypothetical protein